MRKKRPVLTVGEVCRETSVSPRVVINWIDKGLLQAYQLPSKHRRITRKALEAFAAQHSIPLTSTITQS